MSLRAFDPGQKGGDQKWFTNGERAQLGSYIFSENIRNSAELNSAELNSAILAKIALFNSALFNSTRFYSALFNGDKVQERSPTLLI